MTGLAAIGFASPWLLLALAALPILWIVLRAVPPAPIRRRFPGVAILLGLADERHETDTTPWWLLLLRALAVAAAIVGFAGPILNPEPRSTSDRPLLILLDGTWADARDWPRRIERVGAALSEAARNDRRAAVVVLTDPPLDALPFADAASWQNRLSGLDPRPYAPDADRVQALVGRLGEDGFDTLWLSDGLARESRAALLSALQARGTVSIVETGRPVYALRPPGQEAGIVTLSAERVPAAGEAAVSIVAHGPDPNGTERELARVTAQFAAGATSAEVRLSLPAELRNRVTRFAVEGQRSAGAVSLADDALKRREVALVTTREAEEGLQLLSPFHYLRQALSPFADLVEQPLDQALLANPDVMILADVARLAPGEQDAVLDWLDRGGLLVRFAGPELAASDVSRDTEDALMPVRLRAGGRAVGGAMSWGEPKRLAPFAEGSPFHGLAIPGDVTVSAQVLAQPDPDLAARTLATLADGTPLVTRKPIGQGQVVLFHVTANAEWSSLPLSGLFVQMLERLAVSTRPARPEADDLAGTTWVAEELLDAYGEVVDAGGQAGVAGADLAAALVSGAPGAALPPGLYAGAERRIALNVVGAETALAAAVWPSDVAVDGLTVAKQTSLKGPLLAAALILLLADILASLAVAGRLRGPRAGVAGVLLALAISGGADRAPAQDDAVADAFALRATSEVVLAYIRTGDTQTDRMSEAGLQGLSDVLYLRTSVEPGAPIGVSPETDELAFFPLLYWPITASQPLPTADAAARLNAYLRTGGVILFDTRDAQFSGGGTPEARKLQQIAATLDIPPLEPIPADHVLTRTFYLLQDYPGRFAGRAVWVEAAPPDAAQAEGMPFRDLNDGVSPVIIGGNDWAGAWAADERGNPLLPVGRGLTGERQRELAYRFGVNLVMYVLTGNYKSDQVHVPALLERLGQ